MNDHERSRHYLSETVKVRLTPGELAFIDTQAAAMNEGRAYVIRAIIQGWRAITTRPLIEITKPLSELEPNVDHVAPPHMSKK